MADEILILDAQGEDLGFKQESYYRPEWLKWLGLYNETPLVQSCIKVRSDAITASWRTEGKHNEEMAKILDGFIGNEKETFKIMMNNACKVLDVCGDAVFEIVFDEDFDVQNIVQLPIGNIEFVIRNGVIKKYREIDGSARWKPEEILHFSNNPIGAMCHGKSEIEPLNDIIRAWRQLFDDMRGIYHAYVKPLEKFGIATDDPTEISAFITKLKAAQASRTPMLVIPEGSVTYERFGVPEGSVLQPERFHKVIHDIILEHFRVPELALGTGSVNSEESAKMQFDGFRQFVRMKQRIMEETLKQQLFSRQFPKNTPSIKFSFAAEPQEERFNRMRDTYLAIGNSTLVEELKGEIMIAILDEMGLIPNE